MFLNIMVVWALGQNAAADYVSVPQGHEVYTQYSAPAEGQPTVVLVNGLVYDLKRWAPYVRKLRAQGVGILLYNFRGQSKTLLREVEREQEPRFFSTGLDEKYLAEELMQVLEAKKIRQVTVVGLSYGAAIAAEFAARFPDQVEQLILMAPLVVSLDHYDPAGAWIRWNLDTLRLWWGPIWGPIAYDSYYDMIFRSYLVDERLKADRIPAEMAAIPDIYKESIFHLVRAVRDFDLRKYKFTMPTHLMLAADESSALQQDQWCAWEAWGNGASLVQVEGAVHAIPDAAGERAAKITLQILAGDKKFEDGRIYNLRGPRLSECQDLSQLKQKDCR